MPVIDPKWNQAIRKRALLAKAQGSIRRGKRECIMALRHLQGQRPCVCTKSVAGQNEFKCQCLMREGQEAPFLFVAGMLVCGCLCYS